MDLPTILRIGFVSGLSIRYNGFLYPTIHREQKANCTSLISARSFLFGGQHTGAVDDPSSDCR
jgi:hypothetical protein